MISVPRGKDDLSLYRGIPSPLALAPWGFGQLLPAVSFSSCEFCNEQRNVLSVSLHPFIFRKRHWSTRYTQFAMILAGVLLGQTPFSMFRLVLTSQIDCLICLPDKSGNFLVFRVKTAQNTVKPEKTGFGMAITARPRPVFCVFRPKIPRTFYFKLTEQSSREKLAVGGFEPKNDMMQ